jgi:hypothetical protein
MMVAVALASCGGGGAAPQTPANGGGDGSGASAQSADQHPNKPPKQEVTEAVHPCAPGEQTHTHDLHAGAATEALAPCAQGGGHDFSGIIRFENVPNGVRIIIKATDDEVTLLGPDVKNKDAVVVFPRGAGSTAVEIPLMKTADGWEGDKVILFDDLPAEGLEDDGQRVDIAIYDHDHSSGHPAEELHASVNVSIGMSCKAAERAYPQNPNAEAPDTNRLQAPMLSQSFAQGVGGCGLPASSGATVCAFVRNGHAVGVSVRVKPQNNAVAVCLDRLARGLTFPTYAEPGEVKWKAR